MESRPDSGIVVDYFDNFYNLNEFNYQPIPYDNHHLNLQFKKTSLIDLINYINPSTIVSDREVILNLLNVFLGVDNQFLDKFKSSNFILNNLTRTCSLGIIGKFEELSSKIENLNQCVNSYLDDDREAYLDDDCDDEIVNKVNNLTHFTYLISLKNLLIDDVQKVILKIEEQIKFERIQFRSIWEFYEHLNNQQTGHLLFKVTLLDSINHKISQQDSIDNYDKLVLILDNLYSHLQFPTKDNRFLWVLFLNCFKPTLKYLQDFLINGYLDDLNDEFYFENVDYNYESDFWSTCLKSRNQDKIPNCLKQCWPKIVNGLKSRLLMRYANDKFRFVSFSLYNEFIDDLFFNLGFSKKIDDHLLKSAEPLTSNAFSCEYLNQVNNEVSKMFSSVDSIDKMSICTISSISTQISQDSLGQYNLISDQAPQNYSLETDIRKYLDNANQQIENYEHINSNLIESNRLYELEELSLDKQVVAHELDQFVFEENSTFKQNQLKEIKIYFNDSLQRSLDRIIKPISMQVNQLFRKDYLNYLKFYNNYYLFQLEQHSFSLFFDTLFKKLIYDPIQFQENLYTKFYDLLDFGFEDTNLILYLKFSQKFSDDLIYFDIISRLNLIYNDIDWVCSTIINNDAQDFYNRACKVIMKIKFIKWLTNNLPTLNRDFNLQRLRKLPFYNLIHKLFLIKHNLSIVVDTLHLSILIKINSLQLDLFEKTENASNYEELVSVFKGYLNEVGIILHLDYLEANELNLESNPFHTFIRRLCEKAIDIWKIWFSIEQIFYSNFDENNAHPQLRKLLSKKLNDSKKVNKVKKITKTDKIEKKIESFKSEKSFTSRDTKIPKEFDTLLDADEINSSLDEIYSFLTGNAEIFIHN